MHSRLKSSCAFARLALALLVSAPVAAAQDDTEREVENYRQMLKEDPWSNPGLLDADRGEALWKEKRGPRNVSLEQCDLGKGPGKVDGAFAELPRYFKDANRVMDLEIAPRVVHGEAAGLRARRHHQAALLQGQPDRHRARSARDLRRLQVERHEVSPRLEHAKEQQALALGEALFFRRQGPMDFSCATCHGDAGKRIRLQGLPYLSKPEEARKVVGEWPAYRVSQGTVMTMQHRIADCYWQMRLPLIDYGSDVTVALTMFLVNQAKGGAITAPTIKR